MADQNQIQDRVIAQLAIELCSAMEQLGHPVQVEECYKMADDLITQIQSDYNDSQKTA